MSYSIGGYSIEDLAGMTTDELNAILEKEWADLSEQELEEAKTELDEEISAYKDELENAADELEDAVDGIDDDAERADAEKLLSEVEAELENADALEDAADEEYVDIQEHSIDATDGSDVSISELDLDGGTYTYSMSGGSTNPFGEQTDEEYLQDEGITNSDGEVIEDYNLDGVMNQDDIDAALADRDSTLDAQNVFIKTDSSQHWTLVSSDNGTYTFKVEDTSTDPATYAYVTFENAADIVFYFSSGITETDLETLKTTWPTDLLKNSYWGDSTTSFYDELFEEEEETDLTVIAGYNDSVEGLTSSTVSQYADGTLDSTLQTYAEDALEALYGYIDNPSGDSVAEIWSDIWAAWTEAGLSDEQKAELIQYLTLTVALNDKTNFGTLFGPAIVTLETMLDYRTEAHDSYTESDKLIVLLLEGQTGAVGNYGGSSAVWTTAFSTDGENQGDWHDNEENVTAINNYTALVAAMGGTMTGDEVTALANEEAIQEGEATAETEGSATLDEWKNIDDKLYYDTEGEQGSDISMGEWQYFLDVLGNSMFDENGNLKSGDDLWEAIEVAMNEEGTKIEASDQNAILSNLCVLIGKYASKDFKKAFFGAVGKKIKNFLNNADDGLFHVSADNQDDAIDLINKYT